MGIENGTDLGTEVAASDRCPEEGAERPDRSNPPGSAGVPPAHVLAQPRPSPSPGSTGNGARVLLRPGSCRSLRESGRLPHPGETEWYATAVHAGGTPALPGGPPPINLAARGGGRLLARPRPCPSGSHFSM